MSTLKLYRSTPTTSGRWKLLASKLFKIENIESFLAEVPTSNIITIENFQYQKTELEMSIKVDMNQINAEVQTPISIKYASIRNTANGRIAYYFVKRPSSRSQKCVQFDLVLDVLNTYTDGVDFVFKPNTRIIREHKNRYTKVNYCDCTINYQIVDQSGTITEGDDVYLSNNDGVVFIGTLISINQYTMLIKIPNPSDIQVYINKIVPNLGRAFRVYKVGSADDYYEFKPATIQDFSFSTTLNYYRNIDPVAENINPMLHCGDANGIKINHLNLVLNQNWYLLYRNQNAPSESLVNPVECYLIPENNTNIDSAVIANSRLTASSLSEGYYYYARLREVDLLEHLRISQQITLPDGTQLPAVGTTNDWYILITKNAGNTINVDLIIHRDGNMSPYTYIYMSYHNLPYIELDTLPFKFYVSNTYLNLSDLYLGSIWNHEDEWDESSTPASVMGIDLLDKTDAKNIKLIKLPYCPYNFSVSGDKLVLSTDTNWVYGFFDQSGVKFYGLKLKNMNTKLHSEIRDTNTDEYPFHLLRLNMSPDLNDIRSNRDDSKMYHSEFYKPTYYYDSFSFAIALDKCNLTSYIEKYDFEKLVLRFDVTSTINSRFMFTFSNYYIRYGEQNYAKNLIITRNNEEVLYNVPYINYVRTGYNYDVKAKNLSNVANWTGVGLSLASIGASLMVPGVPLKIAGVVGSLITMATSVKSAVTSTIQSEQSLQNKIQQTQNQTASVAGSDDVDLMSVYAENRLKYLVYEPMPNMKMLLNDLFFYAGYNSGRMGVPTHNNRVNFDYLECDAILESITSNMSDDILTELVNAYKTGVTYIHETSRSEDKWDIEQKYENWEVDILEV